MISDLHVMLTGVTGKLIEKNCYQEYSRKMKAKAIFFHYS